jgi:hypothetical protein
LLWTFWKWGSQEVFFQAGLELRSSRSQPLKQLELQTWATSIQLTCTLSKLQYFIMLFKLSLGSFNPYTCEVVFIIPSLWGKIEFRRWRNLSQWVSSKPE